MQQYTLHNVDYKELCSVIIDMQEEDVRNSLKFVTKPKEYDIDLFGEEISIAQTVVETFRTNIYDLFFLQSVKSNLFKFYVQEAKDNITYAPRVIHVFLQIKRGVLALTGYDHIPFEICDTFEKNKENDVLKEFWFIY